MHVVPFPSSLGEMKRREGLFVFFFFGRSARSTHFSVSLKVFIFIFSTNEIPNESMEGLYMCKNKTNYII
jgi:hypothetical protein